MYTLPMDLELRSPAGFFNADFVRLVLLPKQQPGLAGFRNSRQSMGYGLACTQQNPLVAVTDLGNVLLRCHGDRSGSAVGQMIDDKEARSVARLLSVNVGLPP